MALGKAESGDNFKLANVAGYNATVTVGIDDGYSGTTTTLRTRTAPTTITC